MNDSRIVWQAYPSSTAQVVPKPASRRLGFLNRMARYNFSMLATLFLCAGIGPVGSEVVSVEYTLVDSVHLHGGADPNHAGVVVARLAPNAAPESCQGVWIKNDDESFADVVDLLISAQVTRAYIAVRIDTARLWTGSADNYCYVHRVGYPSGF